MLYLFWLISSIAIEKYNMTSARILYSGAAPLGADLVATIRKRLHKVGANTVVSQGVSTSLSLSYPTHLLYHANLAYGLTETSPTLTVLHPDDAKSYIGSIGRVLPNLEVRLVRKDAGEVSVGYLCFSCCGTIADTYLACGIAGPYGS